MIYFWILLILLLIVAYYLCKNYYFFLQERKQLINFCKEDIHLAIISDNDIKKRHLLMNIIARYLDTHLIKKFSFITNVFGHKVKELQEYDISAVDKMPIKETYGFQQHFFLDDDFLFAKMKKDSTVEFQVEHFRHFSIKAWIGTNKALRKDIKKIPGAFNNLIKLGNISKKKPLFFKEFYTLPVIFYDGFHGENKRLKTFNIFISKAEFEDYYL